MLLWPLVGQLQLELHLRQMKFKEQKKLTPVRVLRKTFCSKVFTFGTFVACAAAVAVAVVFFFFVGGHNVVTILDTNPRLEPGLADGEQH